MSTSSPPAAGDRRLVLTVTCPDRAGIVAAVTGFIAEHGGSVVEAAQHADLGLGASSNGSRSWPRASPSGRTNSPGASSEWPTSST